MKQIRIIVIGLVSVAMLGLVNAQESTTPVQKINLNDMAEQQLLATIPDFGNRMVREFFEYQPYISIKQFRREIGKYVDEAQVADYEQYVFVPVDINESDAATIMQIPGVDEPTAEVLIGARPFESDDAFLTKLTELLPDTDADLAASYLSTSE